MLNDIGGNPAYVTLNDNPLVPVPLLFWKVIVSEEHPTYAIIGLNYPRGHPTNAEIPALDDNLFATYFCALTCNDNRFNWLHHNILNNPRSIQNGIIHCCLYNQDFVNKTGIIIPNLSI